MNEQDIFQKITDEFYWFHRHPELSYEEVETTKRLREDLAAAGIEVLDLPLKTGLVAKVGAGEAPFIALRCDIDGLPIQEESGLAYASEHAGRMHACGHDFHISAVLGSAYLLKAKERELRGTVYLIFQPAEEAPGGARKVMETGVLKDVQAIFGLHTSPLYDVGTLGIRSGAVTASVDKFTVTFHGKGTHAAHPERGIDPIVMAASFVTAAQSIVSRNIDPAHPGLVSITHIESGNTWNVIPESSWLEGTVRCLTAEDRKLIKKRIYELAEGQAASFGGHAELTWYAGPPATDNTPDWTDFAIEVAKEAGLNVVPAPVNLAGEDFAYYQEEIPGVFVLVGTGKSPANHNPKFHVDPAALGPAARYMARLAVEAFARL
ncbi:amidohydrolase [Mitsuokella jalaludinii]|uniref:amidohydrolase n=1 Tax=Mitsuokella jalaludinii TaxID=187979 RepID=UPI001D006355|nr:amidohydrolase [Mitsuokella jalaludinii]MCB5724139.1 amidohydrolase [Mitsuokella jalaludinii]